MARDPGTRIIDSPVGPLLLTAMAAGLTQVLFGGGRSRATAGDGGAVAVGVGRTEGAGTGDATTERILDEAERQLGEYFAGERREFDLTLAPMGTNFQMAVWRGLGEIPYGETCSYGELARRIKRPRAVRAVGAANGANPISIIVPCHRVIGADGSLTGFGGGLPAKRTLLALEGHSLDGDLFG